MSNRRRRSILKGRNSLFDSTAVLDETGNLTGQVNFRKRVSFGQKQVKEFQAEHEESPGGGPSQGGKKTLMVAADMDISFVETEDLNRSVRLEEGRKLRFSTTVRDNVDMDISVNENETEDLNRSVRPTRNTKSQFSTTVVGNHDMDISIVEREDLNRSVRRRSVRLESPGCGPSHGGNKTLMVPADMDISLVESEDLNKSVRSTRSNKLPFSTTVRDNADMDITGFVETENQNRSVRLKNPGAGGAELSYGGNRTLMTPADMDITGFVETEDLNRSVRPTRSTKLQFSTTVLGNHDMDISKAETENLNRSVRLKERSKAPFSTTVRDNADMDITAFDRPVEIEQVSKPKIIMRHVEPDVFKMPQSYTMRTRSGGTPVKSKYGVFASSKTPKRNNRQRQETQKGQVAEVPLANQNKENNDPEYEEQFDRDQEESVVYHHEVEQDPLYEDKQYSLHEVEEKLDTNHEEIVDPRHEKKQEPEYDEKLAPLHEEKLPLHEEKLASFHEEKQNPIHEVEEKLESNHEEKQDFLHEEKQDLIHEEIVDPRHEEKQEPEYDEKLASFHEQKLDSHREEKLDSHREEKLDSHHEEKQDPHHEHEENVDPLHEEKQNPHHEHEEKLDSHREEKQEQEYDEKLSSFHKEKVAPLQEDDMDTEYEEMLEHQINPHLGEDSIITSQSMHDYSSISSVFQLSTIMSRNEPPPPPPPLLPAKRYIAGTPDRQNKESKKRRETITLQTHDIPPSPGRRAPQPPPMRQPQLPPKNRKSSKPLASFNSRPVPDIPDHFFISGNIRYFITSRNSLKGIPLINLLDKILGEIAQFSPEQYEQFKHLYEHLLIPSYWLAIEINRTVLASK